MDALFNVQGRRIYSCGSNDDVHTLPAVLWAMRVLDGMAMTTQRNALESARPEIVLALDRARFVGYNYIVGRLEQVLAQIDAALAQPDPPHAGMHDPQAALVVPGERRVSTVLRWEENMLYVGGLRIGRLWQCMLSDAWLYSSFGMVIEKAKTKSEARADLEAAVLAMLTAS